MAVRESYAVDSMRTATVEHTADVVVAKELKQKIDDAIDQLPEQCGKIFRMSRYGNLKYQQIADTLGISVKTVENQMVLMKETNTDELISKYLAGEAGPEEAMELEDWKEQSADNLAYYLECEKLFFADYQINALTNTNVQAALETVKGQLDYTEKQTPVFKLKGLFKYAAAVILVAGAVLVFRYFNQTSGNNSTTYAALDTQKKV
eukprot:gene59148-78924_t